LVRSGEFLIVSFRPVFHLDTWPIGRVALGNGSGKLWE
jgi:hypothetical protein